LINKFILHFTMSLLNQFEARDRNTVLAVFSGLAQQYGRDLAREYILREYHNVPDIAEITRQAWNAAVAGGASAITNMIDQDARAIRDRVIQEGNQVIQVGNTNGFDRTRDISIGPNGIHDDVITINNQHVDDGSTNEPSHTPFPTPTGKSFINLLQ
jgi:hypothetical protein